MRSATVVTATAAALSLACLWDNDTLREESPARRDGAWGVAVTKADADWKKGEAAEARRQKAEDRLVSGRKYKKAFGF